MSPLVSGSPAASSRSTSLVTASRSRGPAGRGVRPMAARRPWNRSTSRSARVRASIPVAGSGSGSASCQRSVPSPVVASVAPVPSDASMMVSVCSSPSRLSPSRGDASVGGRRVICLVFVLSIGVSLAPPLEVSLVTPLAWPSSSRGVILTPLCFGLFPPFSRGVILTPLKPAPFAPSVASTLSSRSARSALACRPGFSDTCSRVTFMQHSQTTDRYGSGT